MFSFSIYLLRISIRWKHEFYIISYMIISNYLQNVLPTSNVGNMLQDLNLRNLEKGQNPNLIHPRDNHETNVTLTGNSFIIHHCKTKQKQESYSHCTISKWNWQLQPKDFSRSVETFKADGSSIKYKHMTSVKNLSSFHLSCGASNTIFSLA
jgi:hypothetical protein